MNIIKTRLRNEMQDEILKDYWIIYFEKLINQYLEHTL